MYSCTLNCKKTNKLTYSSAQPLPQFWRQWREPWCRWAADAPFLCFLGWAWICRRSPVPSRTSVCEADKPHIPKRDEYYILWVLGFTKQNRVSGKVKSIFDDLCFIDVLTKLIFIACLPPWASRVELLSFWAGVSGAFPNRYYCACTLTPYSTS